MNALLLASLVVGQATTAPDLRYMQPARYFAGSPADPEATGGYASSNNLPSALFQRGNGLTANLEKGKSGVLLRLGNAGPPEVWLRAADSNLTAFLEAKDKSGTWKPVEYHHQITCGNSWHRVLLPAQHAWTFSVALPAGDVKTQIRWHFKSAELDLVSNALNFTLARTRFEIEPGLRGQYSLTTQNEMPTLAYNRGG
ncbi:MAG: hypothetical protein K1X67_13555 [Fimbriimonadaceae bacterium]|nr:hypothetical protein [Fimbriimonadaceae bacterium]